MNLRFPYKAGKSLTRRVTVGFYRKTLFVELVNLKYRFLWHLEEGRCTFDWLRDYRPKMGTQCATTHALFMLRHNVCLCCAPFGTINSIAKEQPYCEIGSRGK